VASDPDPTGPTTASGDPATASGEPSPAPDPSPGASSDPPGLRDQVAAVIAAARRLVTAHLDLARAELGAIMGEVGRAAALGGLAFAMVFLAGLLLPIGLLLFLGEWIFGSIGWGVLLGSLLLIDLAVVAGVLAVGIPGRRPGVAFLIALAIGVVTGIVLGLDLTNRAWTAVGDSLMPGVDIGFRPLAIAVLSLAVIGGVIGLVGAAGAGRMAVGGLFRALTGIVLGADRGRLRTAAGPPSGPHDLIAWPALMGLDLS
jgi:hypothetical protein